MANQIMIAGTMTGMTEMLVYAKAANLDVEKVLETLGGGAAKLVHEQLCTTDSKS